MIVDPLLQFAQKFGQVDNALENLFGNIGNNIASPIEQFRIAEKAASGGSGLAMCLCSRFSRKGWGTHKSAADAFNWATKAAATDFGPGYDEVGSCYEEGVGVASSVERVCSRLMGSPAFP